MGIIMPPIGICGIIMLGIMPGIIMPGIIMLGIIMFGIIMFGIIPGIMLGIIGIAAALMVSLLVEPAGRCRRLTRGKSGAARGR
jgi:hypothetical protein